MSGKIPFLHIGLFLATLGSTVMAGAMQLGVNPLDEPGRLVEGLPFALTLMFILLSHELGHYFASRAHHTIATLPYFIPAPSIIGTFGAFIKMKSPIATRRALVDIGASGPIIGFVFSVIASFAGLAMSSVVVVPQMDGLLTLGDSILFSSMSRVLFGALPEGSDIMLHPVAFAGWIGLFVTSLNLIPIGQLDGGHILYAMFGPVHRRVSQILVLVLAVLGLIYWPGWLMWAVLMLVLGLGHPPVYFWESPLDPVRRRIGFVSLLIFILTFTPVPFDISL